MGNVQHTIDQGIAEQHVRMGHVDLCAQHECARLTFTAVHKLKELEVFFYRTVAIGTIGTRTRGRSLLLGYYLGTLLVDIGASLLDEPDGKVPQLLEIVACIVDVGPLEPEPLDVVLDALYVFRVFLDGVCIVEAEVTDTTVFLGQTEVDGDGLSGADMQIAVRLWRETRLESAAVLTCRKVVLYLLFYETCGFLLFTYI